MGAQTTCELQKLKRWKAVTSRMQHAKERGRKDACRRRRGQRLWYARPFRPGNRTSSRLEVLDKVLKAGSLEVSGMAVDKGRPPIAVEERAHLQRGGEPLAGLFLLAARRHKVAGHVDEKKYGAGVVDGRSRETFDTIGGFFDVRAGCTQVVEALLDCQVTERKRRREDVPAGDR